ncbi:hypothetical protein PSI23_12735 [Xenorhabdus sp. XENO-10]|uniref:Transposase n=1 Tax=Xenorhabdus yunnanensis TaxID=3025878 RepID=A0ABT5LGA4_9GAMM|nr:hypothetical protein [Xenorhabdus yunnanensis]MDC9590140.1 hypothetical protein [Xenorhabdus yunnanensis]
MGKIIFFIKAKKDGIPLCLVIIQINRTIGAMLKNKGIESSIDYFYKLLNVAEKLILHNSAIIITTFPKLLRYDFLPIGNNINFQ